MNKNNFHKLYNYCKSLGYPSSESEFYEELQHFIVDELDSSELENISGGTSLKNKFCASVLSALSILSAGSSVGAVGGFESKNSNFSSKAASCSWISKHKEAVISALLGVGGGAVLVGIPTAGVISHLYKQNKHLKKSLDESSTTDSTTDKEQQSDNNPTSNSNIDYFNDMKLNGLDLKNIPQKTKDYINSLIQLVTAQICLETVNFEDLDLWGKYQETLNTYHNDVDEAFKAATSGKIFEVYPELKEAHPELKKLLLFTLLSTMKFYPLQGNSDQSDQIALNCMYGYTKQIDLKISLISNVLARRGDLNEFDKFLSNEIVNEHSFGYFDILRKSSSWMELNKAPQMFVPANNESTEVKLIDFKIDYLNPANKSNLPPEVAKLVDLAQDDTKCGAFFDNINKKYLGLSIPEEPQPSEN